MGNGARHGLPAALIAAAVAAAALGGWLGTRTGGDHGDHLGDRLSVLASYSGDEHGNIAGLAPDASGGVWLAEVVPGTPATESSGALVHVGPNGAASRDPLPAPFSYPGRPIVATDGAVWFDYVQGSGWSPTVDTGPALADPVESMARRSPDGRIERFPVIAADRQPNYFLLTPGSDGTAWFVVTEILPGANARGQMLGHIWPDGHSSFYSMPDELTGLSGLLPSSDGTVWISCWESAHEVVRLNPDTGSILARYPIPGTVDRWADVEGPVAAPGSAVWMATDKRALVKVTDHGRAEQIVAPAELRHPVMLTTDGRGGLWALGPATPNPADATTSVRDLTHVSPDGSVTHQTAPVRLPQSFAGAAEVVRIVAASDGAVWLSAGPTVYRLG